MNDAPLTAAEQKEVRAMLLELVAKNYPDAYLDEVRKKAVLQIRRLKADSAGPAKAAK
ncbi:hypothetical protein NOV72_03699 [Caballeronia novacaledonica]|uniref:Uncharacterized protein n=1 Tax=Caballeronia novacaledonica TaxID=1544861 RepID=A0A2U3I8Q8_9BURK|nr:hypothetical protein [Caballeronia novacaledonica]SPB16499.1 hypothetical protein NOV72_03699 [Caballeronia novacaledonica]